MSTAAPQDGLVDIQDAAFTMAMALLVDRIRSLPPDDREDMIELTKIVVAAENKEEVDSAHRAIREIIDQNPGRLLTLTLPGDEGDAGEIAREIGRRVYEEREKAGLSLEQLSMRTGLPKGHLSRLESGKHSPSYVTIQRLAEAIGIAASVLDPSA